MAVCACVCVQRRGYAHAPRRGGGVPAGIAIAGGGAAQAGQVGSQMTNFQPWVVNFQPKTIWCCPVSGPAPPVLPKPAGKCQLQRPPVSTCRPARCPWVGHGLGGHWPQSCQAHAATRPRGCQAVWPWGCVAVRLWDCGAVGLYTWLVTPTIWRIRPVGFAGFAARYPTPGGLWMTPGLDAGRWTQISGRLHG